MRNILTDSFGRLPRRLRLLLPLLVGELLDEFDIIICDDDDLDTEKPFRWSSNAANKQEQKEIIQKNLSEKKFRSSTNQANQLSLFNQYIQYSNEKNSFEKTCLCSKLQKKHSKNVRCVKNRQKTLFFRSKFYRWTNKNWNTHSLKFNSFS